MDKLSGVRPLEQPKTRTGPQVVDLTGEEDAAAARTTRQLSISGREWSSNEESESSGSTTPHDEPIQARQRCHSRPVWINGILVYRMANMEMVDHAKGLPVCTVDYFAIAVISLYLESLQEESQRMSSW